MLLLLKQGEERHARLKLAPQIGAESGGLSGRIDMAPPELTGNQGQDKGDRMGPAPFLNPMVRFPTSR